MNRAMLDEVTFRQSGRKWLICNQTGEKVSRFNARKARVAITNRLSGHERSPRSIVQETKPSKAQVVKLSQPKLRVAYIWRSFDEVDCPHCFYAIRNVYSEGQKTCPNCNEVFLAEYN